jgi:hypothetical protein
MVMILILLVPQGVFMVLTANGHLEVQGWTKIATTKRGRDTIRGIE